MFAYEKVSPAILYRRRHSIVGSATVRILCNRVKSQASKTLSEVDVSFRVMRTWSRTTLYETELPAQQSTLRLEPGDVQIEVVATPKDASKRMAALDNVEVVYELFDTAPPLARTQPPPIPKAFRNVSPPPRNQHVNGATVTDPQNRHYPRGFL